MNALDSTNRTRAALPLLAALLVCSSASPLGTQSDDLAPLSDEFASAATLGNFTRLYAIEGWGVDRLTTYNINTTRPGALVMVPRASGWYQDYQGELAFKTVTGDFVVTTDVGVTNVAGTGAPGANYAFAGLLVRTPRPSVTSPATWTAGGENWVVQGVGTGANPGTYNYEQKNTVNSVTTPVFPPGSGRAVLQFVRLGNALLVLRQPAGGAWSVVARYNHADFPATLHVGMSAMGNFSAASAIPPLQHNQTVITFASADLVATFDYFRLQRPVVPGNLQGLDFTNPGQVSDAQLLVFLGANANQPPAAGSPGTLQFSAATYSVGENAGSIVLNRVVVADGLTRMPQLGSNELDQEAIALLTAWITQPLPARQTYADWRLARFGSAVSADGAPEAGPDGDRATNREEFLAGTDPLNSQSFPTATPAVGAASVTLGLNLPANRGSESRPRPTC